MALVYRRINFSGRPRRGIQEFKNPRIQGMAQPQLGFLNSWILGFLEFVAPVQQLAVVLYSIFFCSGPEPKRRHSSITMRDKTNMKPLTKRRLFTPGPTPLLPEAVFQSLISPMHHRKEDFKAVFREVQKGLQQVYKTQNEILLLSCSGSGAMEAAMTNPLDPGEKAVVAVCGKF